MNKIKLEVCANSYASALEAQRGGAIRVELCAGIPEGGTTPSYGEISLSRELLDIALNVIIRPRGGDFLYSQSEIEIMKRDIRMAVSLGVDGLVFGCLTKDGEVDVALCRELIQECGGLPLTFHRAFDMCADYKRALEQIIELGFSRILTSGGKSNVLEGKEQLKELVEQAADRIIIMPGCGVNENNIKELSNYTKATEFHSSARTTAPSAMVYRNSDVSMGGVVTIDEYSVDITSDERVRLMVNGFN